MSPYDSFILYTCTIIVISSVGRFPFMEVEEKQHPSKSSQPHGKTLKMEDDLASALSI